MQATRRQQHQQRLQQLPRHLVAGWAQCWRSQLGVTNNPLLLQLQLQVVVCLRLVLVGPGLQTAAAVAAVAQIRMASPSTRQQRLAVLGNRLQSLHCLAARCNQVQQRVLQRQLR
jgi:hypothetical protein